MMTLMMYAAMATLISSAMLKYMSEPTKGSVHENSWARCLTMFALSYTSVVGTIMMMYKTAQLILTMITGGKPF